MDKNEVLKQALEALTFDGFKPEDATHRSIHSKAIKALEEALAKQEQEQEPDDLMIAYLSGLHDAKKSAKQEQKRPQNCGTSYCSCIDCVMDKQEQGEPVAYFNPQVKGGFYWAKPTKITAPVTVSVEPMPLYTTPQQRTWVGLTDEDDIDWEDGGNLKDLVKAIEAKLKEKNT
jgi:hypothetical protein